MGDAAGTCECGKQAWTKGLCKRCYQRRWTRAHADKMRRYQAAWRKKFGAQTESFAPGEVLKIFLALFETSRMEFGGYLLDLRAQHQCPEEARMRRKTFVRKSRMEAGRVA